MITGPLRKMRTEPETPVAYRLPVGDALVALSDRVGDTLVLKFEGQILCANCGRETYRIG